MVKLYQPEEHAGPGFTTAMTQARCLAQVHSAEQNGCRTAGYMWLYADLDPRKAIDNIMALVNGAGWELPFLGIDVETYGAAQSEPGGSVIAAALDQCDLWHVRPVIYSSPSMWARIKNPPLMPGRESWVATYNGDASLDVAGFGGLQIVGHQYTDVPLDLSVFASDLLG